MSVCIAAIAERSVVLAAADRMITASTGDVKSESGQARIWPISRSVFALVAGDVTIQTEILKAVHRGINQRLSTEPENWWSVEDVARQYRGAYLTLRRRKSEEDILWPLGLTMESFVTNQSALNQSVVNSVVERLGAFSFGSGLETIFAGVDADGAGAGPCPHIYVANGADISCHDAVGFAAVGIGKSHAESLLMAGGHWPNKPLNETALLVYRAKKRAEVASGVGKATEMCGVGPKSGSFVSVPPDYITEIDRIYQKFEREVERSESRAKRSVSEFFDRMTRIGIDKQQLEGQQ